MFHVWATYFYLSNDSYTYTIQRVNKIVVPSLSSEPFSVNGSKASETTFFSEVTYKVIFTESGFTARTQMCLNLSDRQSVSSGTKIITASLVNGTYNYTASANGYQDKFGSTTWD